MKADKDLYKRLRDLPKEQLWGVEAARFDAAGAVERMESVAVIRAVGSVFARLGTESEKATVRGWLLSLLKDPQEKIRRYALTALPKIGAGEEGETVVLELLRSSGGEREKHHLGRTLEKVGGQATLAVVSEGFDLSPITVQKVRAGLVRTEHPGGILLDALLPAEEDLRVLLRCRRGLEDFVRAEAVEKLSPAQWHLESAKPGVVTLRPCSDFTLATLYRLRTFATIAFPLGSVISGPDVGNGSWVEPLARCIGSTRARNLMLAATEGTPRYRLEFAGRGHQRGAVRRVVERVHALSPEILNDSRLSPWSVDVIPGTSGRNAEDAVELRPRLYPDPRLGYRTDDIAAASHPPLAACMARLAAETPGSEEGGIIWDPFCGSGLELIERALLGGVKEAIGTDLDPAAIDVARANFDAAAVTGTLNRFTRTDFREAERTAGIAPGSLSLMITNPPLGRRVRIKDMQGLFADLYASAARALKPGGRLVFVNPLRTGPDESSMKLEYRKTVDLGGFNCRLEMYRKTGHSKDSKGNFGGSSTMGRQPASQGKRVPEDLKPPEKAWWSGAGRGKGPRR